MQNLFKIGGIYLKLQLITRINEQTDGGTDGRFFYLSLNLSLNYFAR